MSNTPPTRPSETWSETWSETSSDTSGDAALKQALRAVPPPLSSAEHEALTRRVLAQWGERHGSGAKLAVPSSAGALATGTSATNTLGTPATGALTLRPRLWRHRLWLATAGVATAVALASAVLMTQTDPVLDELMQPDVLSQIAIGEM